MCRRSRTPLAASDQLTTMPLLDRAMTRDFGHRRPWAAHPRSRGIVIGTAVVLGAAALANYVVARRTERRHPPRGRFVEVDGVRLHYTERGSGPPVILIHGNGAMAEDFAISGVLDRLARHHRVIAFDRPGYGYSTRPRSTIWTAGAQAALLRKALHRLGVERPVLAGHSWGTLVALEMALGAPAETGALVLLSGYYVPSLRADVPLLSGPAIPLLGDVMRYTISPLLGWLLRRRIFRKIFAPSPVTPRFAAAFPLGMALRPWQIRASAAETALLIPCAAASLGRHGELRMPVFILAGSGDRIVDTDMQSGTLHRNVPGSGLWVIEGAGHMIHHIAPDAVVGAIEAAIMASSADRERREAASADAVRWTT
jgi:pimeloyl-ACP methyl ester carboxylesterase